MTTLLFFHLVGVITLFVAIALENVTLLAIKRARDVQSLRRAATFAPLIGKLAPAGVVLILAMGIAMVAHSDEFAFGDAWIVMALVLVGVITVEAPTVHGKRMERIAETAEAAPDGALPRDLVARVNDPVMQISATTTSLVALGIVWLMTHQPAWTGTIVTIAVAAVVGAAYGVLLVRRPVPVTSITLPRQAPVTETGSVPVSRSTVSRSTVD